MKKQYEYNKTWRLKHPEQRARGVNRYYNSHSYYRKGERRRAWDYYSCLMIILHLVKDSEMAKQMRRSVKSIQVKRSRLRRSLERFKHNITMMEF